MGFKVAIVAGIALATANVPAFSRGVVAVAPTGDPRNWITSDDYPKPALSDNLTGVVSFALKVG